MTFVKSHVHDLKANPAFMELLDRMAKEEEQADREIENPDPFQHGKAVGRRETLRLFKKMPEILLADASGESQIRSMKP